MKQKTQTQIYNHLYYQTHKVEKKIRNKYLYQIRKMKTTQQKQLEEIQQLITMYKINRQIQIATNNLEEWNQLNEQQKLAHDLLQLYPKKNDENPTNG